MKKLWEYFTCRHYTELSSKSLDSPLSLSEKTRFFLHHIVCTFCRRSTRQMKLLEKASRKLLESEEVVQEELSVEARERIRKKLDGA